MRKQTFNFTLSLLLTLGGCSQIIGLSDYDIDPKLGAAGEASTDGGDGGGGKTNNGGKAGSNNTPGGDTTMPQGGDQNTPQGGDQNMPQGGDQNMPQGGEAPMGGSDLGGAAGAPPIEIIPCADADCCKAAAGTAVGVELLKDGGFELGTPDDGSPWTEAFLKDGSDYVDEAVTNDTSLGFKPKVGDYYAYLSGIQGERATVYSEDIVVPDNAGWIVLSGYRYFQIDKEDATNKDFAGIGFYDLDGNALEIPFYWTGTDPTNGWGSTNALWKSFTATWDAASHAGETRYLGLRGESDKYPATGTPKASSYLFDGISLKAYHCEK